jgi:hypothetical protein
VADNQYMPKLSEAERRALESLTPRSEEEDRLLRHVLSTPTGDAPPPRSEAPEVDDDLVSRVMGAEAVAAMRKRNPNAFRLPSLATVLSAVLVAIILSGLLFWAAMEFLAGFPF